MGKDKSDRSGVLLQKKKTYNDVPFYLFRKDSMCPVGTTWNRVVWFTSRRNTGRETFGGEAMAFEVEVLGG